MNLISLPSPNLRSMIPAAAAIVGAASASFASAPNNDVSGLDELTNRNARVALKDIIVGDEVVGFERVVPGQVPNYMRLFAGFDDGPAAIANLCRSILYDGQVEPELKMAMGLAISLDTRSIYAATHMKRLLGASQRGRTLIRAIEDGSAADLPAADRLALDCGIALTHDVYGLDEHSFGELRSLYNEPQIVELTLVASFFSYFNRMVDATNLPIERWALTPATERAVAGSYAPPEARIGMLSDDEVRIINARLEQGAAGSSLGITMANSIRAMARCSDIREAWGRMGGILRDSHIGPEMQHYVSNEVSYRNGCYYCKTHQVQKLHRVGISIEAIARAVDSHESLSAEQRQAVRFARTVTDDSTSVTDAQFAALVDTFSERGALEILHVAARFNFMNRFTAGLGLPSEPAPMATYERVEKARSSS